MLQWGDTNGLGTLYITYIFARVHTHTHSLSYTTGESINRPGVVPELDEDGL